VVRHTTKTDNRPYIFFDDAINWEIFWEIILYSSGIYLNEVEIARGHFQQDDATTAHTARVSKTLLHDVLRGLNNFKGYFVIMVSRSYTFRLLSTECSERSSLHRLSFNCSKPSQISSEISLRLKYLVSLQTG
jgi:hypothetical protein